MGGNLHDSDRMGRRQEDGFVEGGGEQDIDDRAKAILEQLAQRYECKGDIPSLAEVEKMLWRAREIYRRDLDGPTVSPEDVAMSMGVAHSFDWWVSQKVGWSFPCSEAVELVRRAAMPGLSGRIVDVGAGCGLWTRVLSVELGASRVVGIDPEPKDARVIRATYEDWCEQTGGPGEHDSLLAAWLPCSGMQGSDLGTEILDSMQGEQKLVYVGSGPNDATGTEEFYDRLGREFEEITSEPLPRLDRAVFRPDFIGVYRRRG